MCKVKLIQMTFGIILQIITFPNEKTSSKNISKMKYYIGNVITVPLYTIVDMELSFRDTFTLYKIDFTE